MGGHSRPATASTLAWPPERHNSAVANAASSSSATTTSMTRPSTTPPVSTAPAAPPTPTPRLRKTWEKMGSTRTTKMPMTTASMATSTSG